jgi:carbamoyltransferase
MNILGISCFYHDAAAALIQDGRLVAAVQEERFTRKKHDDRFPSHSIRYCLRAGGIGVDDLDAIGFYDKPLLKFERMLTTFVATFPRSFPQFRRAVPLWVGKKMVIPSIIRKELGYGGRLFFPEHHLSHAASAYLVSPFDSAAVLTVDGVGEWATASYGVGRGGDLELLAELYFPHSLGMLYSAFTHYLGFKVNSAEYKVMGLAPYGQPKFTDRILKNMVELRDDGSFRLNMDYFSYHYGTRMTNGHIERLFGAPHRDPEGPLEQHHKDVAMSVQKVTEEIVLRMARHVHQETGERNLCMAGGVALNCVANGRLLREGPFERLWIQPAAGDAGGAVGAAALVHRALKGGGARVEPMEHSFLGPEYGTEDVRSYLTEHSIPFEELSREALLERTARLIAEQGVVGWFQGRMEFGPRALGSRSILADARNPKNKDVVNLKIKFRESFRPFAPSVLEEQAGEWFELGCESPYMLLVADVRPHKRTIPSVTHVDGSARIQTVRRADHPLYYDLIAEFTRQTGTPVLINTSFNVRGEPIVCTPHDAYLCFMRTDMDYLVLDRFLLDKRRQPPLAEDVDWRTMFELD